MTTLAKLEANRANGRHSTGPRTAAGKAAAKMNATSHGLRSLSPVLPGERPKDWNDYRAGVLAALAPVGTLEVELAERAALLMWRLRRVVRYETAVTAAGIDAAVAEVRGERDEEDSYESFFPSGSSTQRTYAEVRKELNEARGSAEFSTRLGGQLRKLSDMPADQRFEAGDAFNLLLQLTGYTPNAETEAVDVEDDEFLAEVGVPEEWRDEPDWWDGWTAEMVRAGVRVIATDSDMTDAELLERAIRETEQSAACERRKAMRLEAELATKSEEIKDAERVARGRALLPSVEVADKVMRYESHLNKQLTQTLHQLERWQAIRSGNAPTPPAALDVTVESGGLTLNPAG